MKKLLVATIVFSIMGMANLAFPQDNLQFVWDPHPQAEYVDGFRLYEREPP